MKTNIKIKINNQNVLKQNLKYINFLGMLLIYNYKKLKLEKK